MGAARWSRATARREARISRAQSRTSGAVLPLLRRGSTPMAAITPAQWRVCERVAQEHGRTFFFATRFLPPEERRAIHAVYGYCRIADDIADRADPAALDAAYAALDAWEREIDAPVHDVAVAFAAVRETFGISEQPIRDLLAGIRSDLDPALRFETWQDLRLYCYQVAGTVGLLVSPVLGCQDPAAYHRAIDLGIAMQLTNIVRDVGEDAAMGRVYLPQEDLDRFGVDREALLRGQPTGAFPGLLAFEIERARIHYASGLEGLGSLAIWAQVAVLASARLYAGILDRVERQHYDVFSTRAYVPTHRKVIALPAIARSWAGMQIERV